ncbi:hypothetical protein JCM24511_10060 [Saitozyma sp. JCM 24511]|nr:hypothetical protein JCM24511_10060 [Saitozyma sp. JCM 24511]
MSSPPSPTTRGRVSDRQSSGSASGEIQPKRKRKQRQHFSCAECRRLKLKCDRQVPCSNCVRRSCREICPDGTRADRGSTREPPSDLRERLSALENLLTQHGLPVPTSTDQLNQPLVSDTSEHSSRPQPPVETALVPVVPPSEPLAPAFHPAPWDTSPMSRMTHSTFLVPSATRSTAMLPDLSGSNAQTNIDPMPIFEPTITTTPRSVHFDYNVPSSSDGVSSGWNAPAGVPARVTHLEAGEHDQSFGTLVISHSGRSKYLGPTAASEWLKDQEVNENENESPAVSRYPSPERRVDTGQAPSKRARGSVFPFDDVSLPTTTESLLARLPEKDEASVLVESYYRYFSWHFDVAPREGFLPLFEKAYSSKQIIGARIDPQQLGLVFIILAMGSLHCLELPPNDPQADEYLAAAKACLAKGDFMIHNTISGLQALHIMAHFHLETERGRTGDSAWPLWGLAMRIIQAMGLHRDGARWNLPPNVVEERRRVFWESHSADIFQVSLLDDFQRLTIQANCFSRPSSISPKHIDAIFPAEKSTDGEPRGFASLKFALCQISGAILENAMNVVSPPYSTITELHERLVAFEKDVPFHLRCRSVLLALPSRYPDVESAVRDSPEVNKKNLQKTFQQFTLALNISETILFLHRPYFAKALHERLQDPTRSLYGPSYLAVVERCNVIIQIVSTLYALHPNVACRHWYLWYHAFNAAVCMGTLILQSPQNALTPFALAQIDTAISLYTTAVQARVSPRMVKNLQWLFRLRQRAQERISRAQALPGSNREDPPSEDEDDIELIGWRTRLIQRAAKGTQTATTISSNTPGLSNATPSPHTVMTQTIAQALQQHFGPGDDGAPPEDRPSTSSSNPMESSTDVLLHQFWDPMLLQDLPASDENGSAANAMNWWDWDTDFSTASGAQLGQQ